MFLAAIKLCHAASPAPQPQPELLRATPRRPLLSPDTRMCHRDVPREFHPWEEVAGGPWEGQEGALPLAMARAAQDHSCGMQRCCGSHHGNPGTQPGEQSCQERNGEREEKRKVGWKVKKQERQTVMEQRLGQGGAVGRDNNGGGRWSCLEAAPLGMTFSTTTLQVPH